MEAVEHIVFEIIHLCTILTELAGTIVIVTSMVRGLIDFLRRNDHARLHLAQGIMLGLEFKLGSEVLRSVVVSTWSELGMLAAIILLRTALTLLLHWEVQCEEKRHASKAEESFLIHESAVIENHIEG